MLNRTMMWFRATLLALTVLVVTTATANAQAKCLFGRIRSKTGHSVDWPIISLGKEQAVFTNLTIVQSID